MNGIINLLKPPGVTSFYAINIVKRIFNEHKVGHAGTLDPGAAGVLPVLLGRATKLCDYFMSGTKIYIAEMVLGQATDTLDSYGCVIEKKIVPNISCEFINETLSKYVGDISQQIPNFSAVKYKGQPLYKLARKGIRIDTPIKNIYIENIELLSSNFDRFLLKIVCQKGTYIRALIADIGKSLGTCAYTSFLLRTSTGCLNIDDALTFDELSNMEELHKVIISPDKILPSIDNVSLPDYLFDIIMSGATIDLRRANILHLSNNLYKVFCNNIFIGIGECSGDFLKLKTRYYIKNNNASIN